MLSLPEERFNRSVTKHNVDLIALVDWIEASVAFSGEPVSKSEVVDLLCEEHVYDSQDFASFLVDDAWELLRRNASALSQNSLISVRQRAIEPAAAWSDMPATALMLALSIAPLYLKLREQLAGHYATQGSLFERVTMDAMAAKGWRVHSTGWQAGLQTTAFVTVVDGVQAFLFEPLRVPDAEDLLTSANDAGLDLVCVKSFNDQRPAVPVLFVQCASGNNWREKLKTPDPELWQKLIPFIVTPTRAISIPFLLDEARFRKNAFKQSGVLLDRLRLLRDLGAPNDWLEESTRDDLVDWLQPKLAALEGADA